MKISVKDLLAEYESTSSRPGTSQSIAGPGISFSAIADDVDNDDNDEINVDGVDSDDDTALELQRCRCSIERQ